MKDRIKKIRHDAEMNQAEFGRKISISRSAVWKIENGENTPSEQTIKLICKEFGISYLWLTEGIDDVVLRRGLNGSNRRYNDRRKRICKKFI